MCVPAQWLHEDVKLSVPYFAAFFHPCSPARRFCERIVAGAWARLPSVKEPTVCGCDAPHADIFRGVQTSGYVSKVLGVVALH